MATSYTITLLNTINIPADQFGTPASIVAYFIITDGSSWYSMSRGGIPAGTSDVLAFLNAEAADLWRQAPTVGKLITQAQAQAEIYAAFHLSNRAIFVTALYTLDSGIAMMSPVNLANYQTLLQSVLNALSTLPAAFLTHLTNERTAAGITMAVSSMTLAQCYTFDTLLHGWLASRHVQVLVASNRDWWLGITNGG